MTFSCPTSDRLANACFHTKLMADATSWEQRMQPVGTESARDLFAEVDSCWRREGVSVFFTSAAQHSYGCLATKTLKAAW